MRLFYSKNEIFLYFTVNKSDLIQIIDKAPNEKSECLFYRLDKHARNAN